MNPRETLYNPNGGWHTTIMRELSLTVITATWHAANWHLFRQQYRHRGATRGLGKAFVLAYLAAVGAALGIRDRLMIERSK